MAGTTGLEPAASAVTGQRSNQLNYVPTRQINELRNRQCLCAFARLASAVCLQLLATRRLIPVDRREAHVLLRDALTDLILTQRT
jgi:hypothetical protein